MLRKLGAVLLLVGLLLPHSRDVRLATVAGSSAALVVSLGVPVLVTLAYVLHVLMPALARFHDRHGPALHGALRAVFLILAGVYLATALQEGQTALQRLGTATALITCGALLFWQQRRGAKAQRLPLLLLTIAGLPVFHGFVAAGAGGLQLGGWLLTAGYLTVTVVETRGLRGAQKITHGG